MSQNAVCLIYKQRVVKEELMWILQPACYNVTRDSAHKDGLYQIWQVNCHPLWKNKHKTMWKPIRSWGLCSWVPEIVCDFISFCSSFIGLKWVCDCFDTHSVRRVLSSAVSVTSNQLISCFMMLWKNKLRMHLTCRPASRVHNVACVKDTRNVMNPKMAKEALDLEDKKHNDVYGIRTLICC